MKHTLIVLALVLVLSSCSTSSEVQPRLANSSGSTVTKNNKQPVNGRLYIPGKLVWDPINNFYQADWSTGGAAGVLIFSGPYPYDSNSNFDLMASSFTQSGNTTAASTGLNTFFVSYAGGTGGPSYETIEVSYEGYNRTTGTYTGVLGLETWGGSEGGGNSGYTYYGTVRNINGVFYALSNVDGPVE